MFGVQKHNRAYVWNGRNRMRKYDGENWNFAGIDKDDLSGVGVAVGSAGNLSGTYYYYITAANNNHPIQGQFTVESLPSAIIGPVSPAAQQVDISSIPASSGDSQVTHWHIYRNKNGFYDTNTQDETQDFWFVASVAVGTTTYTDDTQDDSLSTQSISFKTEIPPCCKYGDEYGNRLFQFGFDPYTTGTATVNATPTRIDFSGATLTDGFLGCYFQKDGDEKRYEITEVNAGSNYITLGESFSGALSSANYSIYNDRSRVFFSEFNDYDAWGYEGLLQRNALDVGGPGRNRIVRAGKAFDGKLYIFTLDECFIITGNDPDNAAIRITPDPVFSGYSAGCVGGKAIWRDDDGLYYLSVNGPARIRSGSAPELIGERLGWDWLDDLQADELEQACVGSDGRKVYFSVPLSGDTENSVTYVYDKLSGAWWKDKYYHPSFYFLDKDSNGKPALFYTQANYIYQIDTGTDDLGGVPSFTYTSGTATGGSSTTLVDKGADFPTTGSTLKESYVHVYTAAGALRGHGRISSNNGTQLTFAWQGSDGAQGSVVSGDTYTIGGVHWDWTSRTYITGDMDAVQDDIHINFDLQGESTPSTLYKYDIPDETEESLPTSITVNEAKKKIPVDVRGMSYQYRIECRDPGNKIAIRDISLGSEGEGSHT